jgi:uncharacterized protein (DUF302 family)
MRKLIKLQVIRQAVVLFCSAIVTCQSVSAQAGTFGGSPTIVIVAAPYDFATLVSRLEASVTKNDMLVVAKASASAGAEKRGLKIPGDAVVLVFRNDFAVRMLRADTGAGLEAPIPIHVFEAPDGSARIAYRRPSSVFGPYGLPALDEIAGELDPIFERIVTQAVAK